MFTGLIEDTGSVVTLRFNGKAAILTVRTKLPTAEVSTGDSVAVNGSCLTVTSTGIDSMTFDVSEETVSRTTLGKLPVGAPVNLERAMKLGERFGGHIVTGHIDCTATLTRMESRYGSQVMNFSIPAESSRYIVEKGSVALDGISLTVNGVSESGFSVNIIPHTYAATSLNFIKNGAQVNIETDIIGKYVERLVAPWRARGDLSIKKLAENGFI